MNDRLSPNSLCLVRKSLETRPCSFCSRAHVRRNSLEVFGTSSDIFGYYRTPSKNLVTFRIKMSRLYLKKCWQVYLLRRLVKNVTPENVLESNDTSLWRHTATRLANRTIFLHIRFFFGGKTNRPYFDLFIYWLMKQIKNTFRNHFSRSYEANTKIRALFFNILFWFVRTPQAKMQPNKHRKPKVELYNKVYSLKAVHLVPSTLLLNDKHANLQSRLCR